jgi:hypothetical protein
MARLGRAMSRLCGVFFRAPRKHCRERTPRGHLENGREGSLSKSILWHCLYRVGRKLRRAADDYPAESTLSELSFAEGKLFDKDGTRCPTVVFDVASAGSRGSGS